MPIPDTPQTRGEQYLNAMATGDTSGIPDYPHTREEQYLDYIAKNGGGGGGGVMVVNVSITTEDETTIYTCDKTAAEMAAAMQTGWVVFSTLEDGGFFYVLCVSAEFVGGAYRFSAAGFDFTASAGTDYPSYVDGGK